jgi:pSer/pThr/pTyr-binding forkhead associated (FHA) protein
LTHESTATAGPSTAYLIARLKDFRRVFVLEKEFTSAGRTGANEIKLPFGSVSREHARFVRTPMGFKVTDSGSKHGVQVNAVRVVEKFLQEGDKVKLGDVALTFTFRKPRDGKDENLGEIVKGLREEASKLAEQVKALDARLAQVVKRLQAAKE